VLGQQKLTDLRDRIVCLADHIAVGEFSDNPNQQQDVLTKVSAAAPTCIWIYDRRPVHCNSETKLVLILLRPVCVLSISFH